MFQQVLDILTTAAAAPKHLECNFSWIFPAHNL